MTDPQYTEIQINEYSPDTELGFHIDNTVAYLGTIFGVSLLGDCHLTFRHRDHDPVRVFVPRCSLYFMSGKSRSHWQHGIEGPAVLNSERRLSLTFRRVLYTAPIPEFVPKKKRRGKKKNTA